MTWPTSTEIIAGIHGLAIKIAAFAVKAEQVTIMLRDAKLAHEIEAKIPDGARIAEAIEKAVGIEHIIAGSVPIVNDIFALYSLYVVLGGHPKEWGKPNDPVAEAELKERDAQTG